MRPALLALSLLVLASATASALPSQPRVVARIRVGSQPCSSVEARGRLWVTNYGDSTVSVVDPGRNRRVGKPIRVDSSPCGIVFGAGSVWTHAYGSNRLDRINPRKRKVTRRIR